MKLSEHENWILTRVKRSVGPVRVWINSRELLCCGPDFPSNIDWTPVGTYDCNVMEHHFIEDLKFAKSHPEPMMEA